MALILALLAAAPAAQDELGECTDLGTLYVDVTDILGLRAYGNSLGLNLNDFDGDGQLDVYVATGPSRVEHSMYLPGESLLFLRDADGVGFSEVGGAWGVDDMCEDRAPLFGDLDNDGLADLYVTVNGRNLLLRSSGGAGFVDVTAESGAAGHPGWGHTGLLLDYDRDGFLDVFFTNGPEDGSGPDVLLHNMADGRFEDASEDAGLSADPSGKGACVLDVDVDGWPDLFVTTGREYGNHLYMNQGDGRFVDVAHRWGLADPERRFGVGAVCEDLDNDGDPDILLVTHDGAFTGNQLFRNDGGSFNDVARNSGLEGYIDGHGLALVDIDNDGLLDVVMSGIRTQPYVFRNLGGMRFERLCSGAGVRQTEGVTWAAAAGDLDGDGWNELFISNGLGRRPRGNSVYQHLGGSAHWLSVEVQGVTHNPSAIGAKVEVELGEQTLTRWVGTWSAFDSQGPLPLHFGLGEAEQADAVRVSFTNGEVVELGAVAADQRLVVVEPADRGDDDADGVPDEWDACPGTRLGHRTDGEGCAMGQRGGPALALSSPEQDAVLTLPPVFRWTGTARSAVLQVSLDGTFGPAGRLDFGPVTTLTAGEGALDAGLTLTEAQWAEIVAASDGSAALLWRVVAVDADGGEAVTEPRRFYAAQPAEAVHVPRGANIFEPAHVVVGVGETVSWWNDSVAGGNLQAEPHDVQLVDESGVVVSPMEALNAAGLFTWTFTEPGRWSYICQRHSGTGSHGDHVMETPSATRADGPYRCMAGTVTVR
ncbi:MAG: VCBS repeat-containing protein [Alphaproteobacteria bacterium]|nr:VCBS repeat-containing protein [Alphaproteobacteria bacterium]